MNGLSARDRDFIPALRFMVCSDVHIKDEQCIEEERFAAAIKDAYAFARACGEYDRLDAIYVVGDFATSGTEIQMKKAKRILDENVDYAETRVIEQIASHETNTPGYAEASRRLKEIMGCAPDNHDIINGFHFISVSPSHKCNYDEAKKAWVAAELEKAAEDGREKPVFVFQHPHNTDTVYGSMLWGEDDLMTVYMNYPQIIHFSGHSHAPVNSPRSVHQQHFTSVGTGTLSYFEMDEFDKICGTFPEGKEKAAQMLMVEADRDNRVRIYPYDVITGRLFGPVWKIDVPSDPDTFIYTTRRFKTADRPYFEAGAKIVPEETGRDYIKITFDQAKDDGDGVNSYDLTLKDKDGFVAKRASIWSDYYFSDMPPALSFTFEGLRPQTEYTVEISANGFWYNSSENRLTLRVGTI